MARVFRLGDFFGITATQVALFQPEAFSKLLELQYSAQVNESIFSFTKEIEFLKKTLNACATSPDYASMTQTFKDLGYLGITESDNPMVVRGKISKFYKDMNEMSSEDLAGKYGSDAYEIRDFIQSGLTIDASSILPSVKDTKTLEACMVIVRAIYNNKAFIQDVEDMCHKAYANNQTDEKKIGGRAIREILALDSNNDKSNARCCVFVGQLYTNIRNARGNKVVEDAQFRVLEQNIRTIQGEYEAKDTVLSSIETITDILEKIYADITLEKLNEITGLDLTVEDANRIFVILDSALIGGLGFNSREMGQTLCDSVRHEDTKGWTRKQREHNDKLDMLLRMAYVDLKSRQAMQKV